MGYDTTPLVAASSRDEWAGDRILTSDLSNASESPPVEPIKPPYRLWVAGIACWLAESYQYGGFFMIVCGINVSLAHTQVGPMSLVG